MRLLLVVSWLGLAACALPGVWQSNECALTNFGYVSTVIRFTGNTYSLERSYFADSACMSQMFVQYTFGSYFLQGTTSRTLFVGTNPTPTTSQNVYSLSRARVNYVPSTAAGAAYLNGVLAAAGSTSCPSRARIGVFGVGNVKDVSFLHCTDLDVYSIFECSTLNTIGYQDSTGNYFSVSTNAAMCVPSYPSTATFNDNNCAGTDAGCVTHILSQMPALDYVGDWTMPCRSYNINTSAGLMAMSDQGTMTLGVTDWSTQIRKFLGTGCVAGSELLRIAEHGTLQIDRQVSGTSASPVFLGDFSIMTRSILPPLPTSVAMITGVMTAGDTDCSHELRNLTAGVYRSATYATCGLLRIASQAACPTYYWMLQLSGNSLSLPDPELGSPCVYPTSLPASVVTWQRTSTPGLAATQVPIFGTAAPGFFFGGGQAQAQAIVYFFFVGLDEARTTQNFSFVQTLITDDFSLSYPGNPTFVALSGLYKAGAAQPKYGAISTFLAAWTLQYSTSYRGAYVVLGGGDEYSAVVQFSESLQLAATNKGITNMASSWIFQLRNGMISGISIQTDTLAVAAASCPSGLMCGQSPPVTSYTTITTTNITTLTTNVYNSAPAPSPTPAPSATAGIFDNNLHVYLGLAAIIFVLSVFLMAGLLWAARNVTALQVVLDRNRYSFRGNDDGDQEVAAIPARHHVESPVV